MKKFAWTLYEIVIRTLIHIRLNRPDHNAAEGCDVAMGRRIGRVGLASGGSGLHQNLNLAVSPTALEASAAVTGIIVSHHVQQILPGLAKSDHRRRFSAEGGRVFRFRFLHLGPGRIKRHLSRPAIF